MKIPIRNIYYLLAYAWDRLQEAGTVDVGEQEFKELIDLLAKVLVSGTSHMLRRGMARGYEPVEETIPGIRGRIQFSQSLRENAFQQGRANCSFDELSYDILSNQILRATVRSATRVNGLEKSIRNDLSGLLKRLEPVSDIDLRTNHFRQVQIHRNNAFYAFLLNICRLIYDNLLPTEGGRTYNFRDFVRDDRALASLFENFVRNFYDHEARQVGWSAGQRSFAWQDISGDPASVGRIPGMTTDVTLQNDGKTMILDTKYYSSSLQTVFDKESFHSTNLYQLFTYLKNYAVLKGRSPSDIHGVLLYPTVEEDFDHRLMMHGHPVRICTVNLADDWKNIYQRLLGILPSELLADYSLYPRHHE